MLTYPLGLYRGDTYRWQFTLWQDSAHTLPVDLTGVVVAAEIRVTSGATPTVLPCSVAANVITVTLSASACQGLPASAHWDLQLTYPSGDVQTVVRGAVSVTADVTGSVVLAGVSHG